jgi:ADP-ribosylglycohydrolase
VLPSDYEARVYAGVLGKIIGVYLGRPFEGWSHGRIERELGEIRGYVHEKLGQPLIVTDDDISGTFTFLRALEDYDFDPYIGPEQIGQTWLNYLIENRTVLWWGGMGMSTEHTAYLRLKNGIKAPLSGSIEQNGRTVAEQIGAQIFIDGWGLIHPGDPSAAADWAKRAGSVSHDGEALYGAQVVAATVASAFVRSNVDELIDDALAQIPDDCLIARVIADLRTWHREGLDWRTGFKRIEERYGYDIYGGNCHMVPNHALIIHALLHGAGDMEESLMIVNTCGWDTDCNSGNVGCILGVLNGLEGIPNHLRKPVRDRMFLPTSDGGRCITDALRESQIICNYARRLRGEEPKPYPRFNFAQAGSTQGFKGAGPSSPALPPTALGPEAQLTEFTTATFMSPEEAKMPGYQLMASPTLYSGQTIKAAFKEQPERFWLCAKVWESEEVTTHLGPENSLNWTLPDFDGYPIIEVGIRYEGEATLASLDWSGEPDLRFRALPGDAWRKQWVNGVDEWAPWGSAFRLIQNEGTGLLITGAREWKDVHVAASITPNLAERFGIACRVQGMRRYYALLLCNDGFARLIKALDGETVLAEKPFDLMLGMDYDLEISAQGSTISCIVDGDPLFTAEDSHHPLTGGGIAYVLTEGRIDSEGISVENLEAQNASQSKT